MKKSKIVLIVVSIFLVISIITLSLLYAFLPAFKNAFDKTFKLNKNIPTTNATTTSRVVLEELENKVVKIENDLIIFEDELKNIDSSNSAKIEELTNKINDVKTELVVIKYQINLIKTNLTNYSNPNLLINGNFSINQRGEESYSASSEYTVDRWINSESSTTVIPSSNGIRLLRNENEKYNRNAIVQSIEKFEFLEGRTVTCSIKVSDNFVTNGVKFGLSVSRYANSNSKKLVESSVVTKNGVYSVTVTLPETFDELKADGYNFLGFYIEMDFEAEENEYVDIEWAKLEFGSMFTEFNPRLYAEELNLCQRYYLQLGKLIEFEAVGIGQFNTENTVFCSGLYPIEMRISPITELMGILKIRTGNKYLDSTSLNNFGSDKSYQLSVTTNGTQTPGYACDLFLDKNSYLIFNAEIY